MRKAPCTVAIAGFVVMLAASMPAYPQANLKVFADTPLRATLIEIGEAFRRDGGPQVDFVFGPSPVIFKKLADGEATDVLIAQPHHIADLIKAEKIRAAGADAQTAARRSAARRWAARLAAYERCSQISEADCPTRLDNFRGATGTRSGGGLRLSTGE